MGRARSGTVGAWRAAANYREPDREAAHEKDAWRGCMRG